MKKKLTQMVDKLLQNSENKLSLASLELIMNRFIPFNHPHKFKFIELSDKRTQVRIPYIKNNKNHLGGLHACSIATAGEYAAGLSLIKRFGISKYRLIMGSLRAEYHKQAITDLTSKVSLDQAEVDRILSELKEHNKTEIELCAKLYNDSEECIAEVFTTWQLKNWDKVTFNKKE